MARSRFTHRSARQSLARTSGRASRTEHIASMGFRVWELASLYDMPAAHTHPDIELNFLLRGEIHYLLAGRRAVIRAGQLGCFWGGVPHQTLPGPAGASSDTPLDRPAGIWITLPLAWFLRCRLAPNFAPSLLSGGMAVTEFPEARARQWLTDFSAGPELQRVLMLELEAQLARLSLSHTPPRPQPAAREPRHAAHSSSATSLVDRSIAFLVRNYARPVGVPDVAEALGVHPKYLMTRFRQLCGVTVGDYLLALRLAHAQRLLVTTGLPVLDVAVQSGFGSLSRFYSAFAARTGERPLHFRRRHLPTPMKTEKH